MRGKRTARRPYAALLPAVLTLVLAACAGATSPQGARGDAPTAGVTAPATTPGRPTSGTGTDPTATSTDADTGTDGAEGADLSGTLRVYSSVTQDTVDAVVAAYRETHPGVEVEVFRAPTGELNARIAAERRDGDVQADVLWLTDPLSMQQFDAEGLLRSWTPDGADAIDEAHREETFWGTRLLNMVVVHAEDLEPAPTSWEDLAEADWDQPVAIPDPGFAGSAFGALGYFALDERYGIDYYRALAETGAVQVQAPGEVVTGVAEGRFSAGMTLDRAARDAIDAGSPIAMVAPDPGAIAIYSPVAVIDATDEAEIAESFAEFTLTPRAQGRIAETGWEPVRDDVPWEHDFAAVSPDWDAIFDRQDELLEQYREIFGG